MKKAAMILSYILVAALASAATLFYFGGTPEVSKLDELSMLIETMFIGEVDRTAMEDAAADAMVNSLGDKWSYYIPADQFEAHVEQMNNAYVGIGVTVTPLEDGSGFEIIQVSKGGPAEEAGLQVGDAILGADGQSAAGLTSEELGKIVKGEENTQVVLTVRRDGREFELPVMRKASRPSLRKAP